MPNQQGGKNYKKSKHSTGADTVRLEEAGQDELYGRVIKVLGNLNMNVYCNDNIVRICKVRGSMRKRVWINVGDLVIISLRNLENEDVKKDMHDSDRRNIDRGDIVHKIDPSLHSKAKKLVGINPKLFLHLETADVKGLNELGARSEADFLDDNDVFEFDDGSAEAHATEGASDDEEDSEDEKKRNTGKKKARAAESKHVAAQMNAVDDDINIDDI